MPIFLVMLTTLLVSCGQARKTDVQGRHVAPLESKTFAPEDQVLTTNVLFLWKRDVTAAQVTRMTTLGQQLAALNLQREGLMLRRVPVPPELPMQIAGLVRQMSEHSDEFRIPPSIELKLGKTPMVLVIQGWDAVLSELRYEPVGGILTFRAKEPGGNDYSVRLSRNRYDLLPQGLVSYYGDVQVRTSAGETRHGVAKFLGARRPSS